MIPPNSLRQGSTCLSCYRTREPLKDFSMLASYKSFSRQYWPRKRTSQHWCQYRISILIRDNTLHQLSLAMKIKQSSFHWLLSFDLLYNIVDKSTFNFFLMLLFLNCIVIEWFSSQGLRSNWSLVNQTYQGLSLLTDTLYKRQKRAKVFIWIMILFYLCLWSWDQTIHVLISIHTSGGESVEPVGKVHPDVGGPHHHLHHRQPLPPLLENCVFQIFGQTQMHLILLGRAQNNF